MGAITHAWGGGAITMACEPIPGRGAITNACEPLTRRWGSRVHRVGAIIKAWAPFTKRGDYYQGEGGIREVRVAVTYQHLGATYKLWGAIAGARSPFTRRARNCQGVDAIYKTLFIKRYIYKP